MRTIVRLSAFAIGLSLLLTGCGGGGGGDSSALPAPDFQLATVDGSQTVTLADFDGKVLILDFWATWCPPCKREIPHFNELYEEYRDKGLEILGVSVDQGGAEVVAQYMESSAASLRPEYPLVMANGEVVAAYGPIGSIPTTVVIDRKGRKQKVFVGYQEKEIFVSVIEELL